MSREAMVLRTERVDGEDGYGLDVVVDPDGQPITVPHYSAPGVDAVPLAGDSLALSAASGQGAEAAVGYADTQNAGTAQPGEVRVYARDVTGVVKVELWLKGDGSALLANAFGRIELAANGTVTINGVTIDPAGNVAAPGEVSAKAGTPATRVRLSTHVHISGTGPTTPPTAGS